MGQRWLRGPLASNANLGDSTNDWARIPKDFNLFCYYFFKYILKYTVIDSGVQAGSTWNWEAHEHTAADGVVTNTDYTFSSAAALFAAGDVGKFLVLVDETNEKNCGIYEVNSYVSPSQVTLNWYTNAGNYPIASTGITWYLIDGDTAGDPRQDDFFVIEVAHATSPYTAKFRWLGYGGGAYNGGGLGVEVAPHLSAWDTGTNDWLTTALGRLRERKLTRGYVTSGHGRTFAYGHTDGSFWMLWDHHVNGSNTKEGAGVCILNPLEGSPTPEVNELVFCFGSGLSSNNSSAWGRQVTDGIQEMGWGSVWSASRGQWDDCWFMAWYLGGDIFRTNVGVNARTGKRDALPIWILRDPQNSDDNFAPWGEIPPGHMVAATVNIIGEHVDFDSSNYLHLRDDVVIPWPGWPFA